MKVEDSTVDFDLSKLTLDELLKVYKEINDFIKFLDDTRIEEKGNEDE